MFEVRSLDQKAASLPVPPTIINDLPAHTEEDRQRIRELAVTTYDKTDKLTAVPQCHCGTTKYAHNIGLTCDHCGHPVEHFSSRTIRPDLWFSAPEGVKGLINPLVYNHLSGFIKSGSFRGLDWMIRDTVRTPDIRGRAGNIIKRFNELGISRGLNSFIDNFQLIFEKVILKEAPRKDRAELQRYVDMYRDKFFVNMLPMPSKVMFIVEETSVGNYYNDIMNSCLDAIYTATSINSAFSERRIMNASALVCMQMAKFYDVTFSKFISGKGAWLRSAVYGNRSLFCFRNIITSDHDIHRYDEIKVPYKLLLNCLKTPVMHKLIYKHDFTYRQAHNYITRHARRTDPFLKTILEELIAETPNGRGIGCIFVRYPSLKRSSYMHVYITGVTETETRISVLNLVGCNADFDQTVELKPIELLERINATHPSGIRKDRRHGHESRKNEWMDIRLCLAGEGAHLRINRVSPTYRNNVQSAAKLLRIVVRQGTENVQRLSKGCGNTEPSRVGHKRTHVQVIRSGGAVGKELAA